MPDREMVIEGFEMSYRYSNVDDGNTLVPQQLVLDAIALLKAQEISIEKVAEDYGLTPDGVSFALSQYQTVISEITHGMLSKLTYNAKDVLQTAQERWCDTCELQKAQEPIAPVKVNRYMETDENGIWFSSETYDCGNCGVELVDKANYCGIKSHGKANYCHICGRAVKWE